MAIFTTLVKSLRDMDYNLDMSEYPIFDEAYRPILNKKILDHYNFYEIGFETAGLFKFNLNTKLNEIMPYYNQLYKSELLKFDALKPTNIQEKYIHNANGTNTGNSNSNSSSNSKSLFQDTPQSPIPSVSLENQKYATNITFDNNSINDNTTNNTSFNNTEDYIKEIIGNNGSISSSKLLQEFRETFLNIDMQIINDLSDLFMGLWK